MELLETYVFLIRISNLTGVSYHLGDLGLIAFLGNPAKVIKYFELELFTDCVDFYSHLLDGRVDISLGGGGDRC